MNLTPATLREPPWEGQELPGPRRRWKGRLLQALLLVVIFVSGGISGWAVAMLYEREHNPPAPPPWNPRGSRERIMQRFSEGYELTEEQTERIGASAQRMLDNMAEIRHQYFPLIRQEGTRFEEDVAGILNAEQRAKWEQSLKAHREQRERDQQEGRRGRHRREGGSSANKPSASEAPVTPSPAADAPPVSKPEALVAP